MLGDGRRRYPYTALKLWGGRTRLGGIVRSSRVRATLRSRNERAVGAMPRLGGRPVVDTVHSWEASWPRTTDRASRTTSSTSAEGQGHEQGAGGEDRQRPGLLYQGRKLGQAQYGGGLPELRPEDAVAVERFGDLGCSTGRGPCSGGSGAGGGRTRRRRRCGAWTSSRARFYKKNGRIQEERTYPRSADPRRSEG